MPFFKKSDLINRLLALEKYIRISEPFFIRLVDHKAADPYRRENLSAFACALILLFKLLAGAGFDDIYILTRDQV